MGNRAEAIRQKKARNKGYYASDISECKYKYGGACWHAWMDGWNANESHLTKRAADVCHVCGVKYSYPDQLVCRKCGTHR